MRLTAAARSGDPTLASASATLAELRGGECARLVAVDLQGRDREILSALGLSTGCRFRVCRAGDPWIVQVRTTRIGLADAVARKLRVLPER